MSYLAGQSVLSERAPANESNSVVVDDLVVTVIPQPPAEVLVTTGSNSSNDKDVTSIIQQAIRETETHGFSVSRQMAFVQFLSSLKDLKLKLFSDMILKSMLNLIVTIVRMHCSNQINTNEQPTLNHDILV